MRCNAYLRLMKIKNSHPPDINNFKRNLDVILYIIHVSFFCPIELYKRSS